MADNNSDWTAKMVQDLRKAQAMRVNDDPKKWTAEERAYMENLANQASLPHDTFGHAPDPLKATQDKQVWDKDRFPDPAVEADWDNMVRSIDAQKNRPRGDGINILGDLRDIQSKLQYVSDCMRRYLDEDDYDFHWHTNATALRQALDKLNELLLGE